MTDTIEIEGQRFRVVETPDLGYDGQADLAERILWIRAGMTEPTRSEVLESVRWQAEDAIQRDTGRAMNRDRAISTPFMCIKFQQRGRPDQIFYVRVCYEIIRCQGRRCKYRMGIDGRTILISPHVRPAKRLPLVAKLLGELKGI